MKNFLKLSLGLWVGTAFASSGVGLCPEILRGIYAHAQMEVLSAREKNQAFVVGRVLAAFLSHGGQEGQDLETALRGVLQLSSDEAKRVTQAFSRLDDPFLIQGLVRRLKYLVRFGTPAQLRAFLLLIPRLDDPYELPLDSFLVWHPDLVPWITRAKKNLEDDPSGLIGHIIGECDFASSSPEGPQSTGGGHALSSWDRVVDAQAAALPEDVRKRIEDHAIRWEGKSNQELWAFEFKNEVGFDTSRKGWVRHLVGRQNTWGIDKKPNGSIALWLPRELFTERAWTNTVLSARYGTSPIGGKSIFPVQWSMDRIRDAVLKVLADPLAQVLRRTTKIGKPSFYLASTVDGVEIEVGITADQVKTAFPAWRQYRPKTIRQAYLEWWSAHQRAFESGGNINYSEWAEKDLNPPLDLIPLYFGEEVSDLGSDVSQRLHLVLSPANLYKLWQAGYDPGVLGSEGGANHLGPENARGFQTVIFDWLQRGRVVQHLEGVRGKVRF